MDFSHAHVHQARLRALLLRVTIGTDSTPPLLRMIKCPACGDPYFAVSDPDHRLPAYDELEGRALVRLEAECPDHAHQFCVEG